MNWPIRPIYYADHYPLPLPAEHRFPKDKYKLTRTALLEVDFSVDKFAVSPLISRLDLESVHCPNYVERVFNGQLTPKEQRRIGFPWSKELVLRCRASTGGTLAAGRDALETGYGAQLAGGTHHAHYDFGAGFCVFNDFAVAATVLIKEQLVERVAILDLDVHQGDGNATMLSLRNDVLVVSLHGAKNYPAKKPPSDFDFPLPDQSGDETFLTALTEALEHIAAFGPDLLLYQAGVDSLAEDRLGRLRLSMNGLRQRDQQVFEFVRTTRMPCVHVLGGGYATPIELSVAAYVQTFEVARSILHR